MDSFYELEKINEAAALLLRSFNSSKVIAFHGEMGAGKTTFIKAVCRELGVDGAVSSPTYSIINQYKTREGKTVYHLDLYRLKNEEEAMQAGVEDCFYSGDICLVEWPEKTPTLLPATTLHCYLVDAGNNGRNLKIKL